jgi:hypothetical protein
MQPGPWYRQEEGRRASQEEVNVRPDTCDRSFFGCHQQGGFLRVVTLVPLGLWISLVFLFLDFPRLSVCFVPSSFAGAKGHDRYPRVVLGQTIDMEGFSRSGSTSAASVPRLLNSTTSLHPFKAITGQRARMMGCCTAVSCLVAHVGYTSSTRRRS